MDSSWEASSEWYDKIVGLEGHYYHQHVILPGVLKLLNLSNELSPKILDIGCGQGILARRLPPSVSYVGVDLSRTLIHTAKKYSKHTFIVSDATKPLPIEQRNFTHATFLVSLQNMPQGDLALKNAYHHLAPGGKLLIVLNHPCYRIPRQSRWEIDPSNKQQYRRIDAYYSEMEIPIATHPGKQGSAQTTSYHHPISTYTEWLFQAGFLIEKMEEWLSDKKSTGKMARAENRSRKEFPLFLAILCRK